LSFYGLLAVGLSIGRSARLRALLWIGAGIVALVVGASRVYLGAHWLTDVLAGYALGVAWIALLLAISRLMTVRDPRTAATEQDDGRGATRPRP